MVLYACPQETEDNNPERRRRKCLERTSENLVRCGVAECLTPGHVIWLGRQAVFLRALILCD